MGNCPYCGIEYIELTMNRQAITEYNRYSDTELVHKLAESKQQALVALYNRYWDKLFVVAANLLGNAEEAEECVQNVFVGLWNRRENLQLTHTLHAYLAVAVKYQSLTVLARRQRTPEHRRYEDALSEPVDNLSPESEFIAKEVMQRVEQSINQLPPQCQLVFRLSREHDKSIKAIATELNLSNNTVKMHLKRANRKLRENLRLVLFFFFIHPFL